jgi:hypothetical protein
MNDDFLKKIIVTAVALLGLASWMVLGHVERKKSASIIVRPISQLIADSDPTWGMRRGGTEMPVLSDNNLADEYALDWRSPVRH